MNFGSREAPFVVGMTGASGAPYAQRLLRFFVEQKMFVHLLLTSSSLQVIQEESGVELGNTLISMQRGLKEWIGQNSEPYVKLHDLHDWKSPLASGSYKCGPMVVVPCSVHSLSAIANSHASNLLERRADIMLKEKEKLVIVFRETPLNSTHLEHLLKLSHMGAHILPAMPGFYHQPKTIQDLIDFMVGRILDVLGVPNHLFKRWSENPENPMDRMTTGVAMT